MASIALCLVFASRSISVRTVSARWSTFGLDLLVSPQASSAIRISSVTERSLSWAITSSYARSPSVMRTLSGRVGPRADIGTSAGVLSLMVSLLIGSGQRTWWLSREPQADEEDASV